MADLIFPPSLSPRRVTWTLERNVATYTSPYSFTSQRNDLGRAARWRASIEMPPLPPDDAALLSTWLDQISRGEHVGLIPVYQNYLDATFASSEGAPLTRSWTAGEASLWSTNAGGVTATVTGGILILRAGGTPNGFDRMFNIRVGRSYTLTLDIPSFGTQWRLRVDHTASTVAVVDTISSATGRQVFRFTSSVTPIRVALHGGDNMTPFAESVYGDVNLYPTLDIEEVAAAGSNRLILIGDRATLNNRVVRTGQFFNVPTTRGIELKRALRDAINVGAVTYQGVTVNHAGNLRFEPALRGSVVVGAGLYDQTPVCRMRLATPESTAVVDAPNFSGFTFEMVEDIAP